MTDYLYVAQTGKPYGTCWSWDSFPGTQFANRGNSWMPVSPTDNDYRCLPDPMPAEFQMFNVQPPCKEASCVSCINANGAKKCKELPLIEQCPSCKRELSANLAGYTWDKNVPNSLLYKLPYRYYAN